MIEGQASATDKVEWEFKSDHTYIMTSATSRVRFSSASGTWSVAGDQLAILPDAAKRKKIEPMTYTFSITGNSMIKTMITKPPYNTIVYKTEDISTRM